MNQVPPQGRLWNRCTNAPEEAGTAEAPALIYGTTSCIGGEAVPL